MRLSNQPNPFPPVPNPEGHPAMRQCRWWQYPHIVLAEHPKFSPHCYEFRNMLTGMMVCMRARQVINFVMMPALSHKPIPVLHTLTPGEPDTFECFHGYN